MKPKKRGRNIFEPTARDIRRACEKIQENWSDQEQRGLVNHTETTGCRPSLCSMRSTMIALSSRTTHTSSASSKQENRAGILPAMPRQPGCRYS